MPSRTTPKRRTYERPTKSQLDDATRRADLALAEADELRARVQIAEFERDSWRAEHLEVPEAECLARCVRAIEQLLSADGVAPAMSVSIGGNVTVHGGVPVQFCRIDEGIHEDVEEPRRYVEAEESPVGRVLLHLASRYGVALWGDR